MPTSIPHRALGSWPTLLALLACVAACSDNSGTANGSGTSPDGGGGGASSSGNSSGSTSGYYDGGIVMSPGTNPCPSVANAPGTVFDFAWPNAKNDGNDTSENQTVRFTWADAKAHNVLELAGWAGQSAPLGKLANAGWMNELYSGSAIAAAGHTFDWNTGSFPCGYRPGLYYLADENNPSTPITVWSLTVPEKTGSDPAGYYAPKSCAELSDAKVYEGRYASYASRPQCTQYEVNNFQTEAHYDWVSPTFGANQGDLVLFRWTGLHNIIQVHDQSKDEPFDNSGILSGPRTNCVGGPNYSCVNGPPTLGEYMLDTKNYRPGVIHMSDQCAYSGCQGCPTACDPTQQANYAMGFGTPFLLFLQRPVRPAPPTAGACCALDGGKYKSKGQACRVIDLYNDNEGTQFDTGLGGGITVNRGDIVRFRWAGAVKIVQTTATDVATGVASKNPMAGGVAMASAVECVPGPDWTCLGGNTGQAELIFDVDGAMQAGHFQTFPYQQDFFDFYAFADNSQDPYKTTQDSSILLPVGQATAYADNPACK